MEPTARFFDTFGDYRAVFREALALAERSLVLFDPDLRATGLESLAGIEALEGFLSRSRAEHSARILLHSPTYVERECPRVLELVLRFGHRAAIRVTDAAWRGFSQPFLVVDGRHLVTRFHHDRARGKLCFEDGHAAAIRHAQFETMWISAQPGPTGAPLGI